MPPIAKFALAAITGGVAIGALAAASVPRTPVEAAPSEWADSDRAAPVTDGQAAAPDNRDLAPIPDNAPQTAYAPMDEAGAGANAAPDDADARPDDANAPSADDAAPPQDDRAAQAADAAREAADDARAAEAAPDAPQG